MTPLAAASGPVLIAPSTIALKSGSSAVLALSLFPQMFGGLLDDTTTEPEPDTEVSRDKRNKQTVPAAAQATQSQTPTLPFLLNFQLPQSDSPAPSVTTGANSPPEMTQPSFARPQQPEIAMEEQSVPQKAGGTPWKETTTPLQDAKLAFAARISVSEPTEPPATSAPSAPSQPRPPSAPTAKSLPIPKHLTAAQDPISVAPSGTQTDEPDSNADPQQGNSDSQTQAKAPLKAESHKVAAVDMPERPEAQPAAVSRAGDATLDIAQQIITPHAATHDTQPVSGDAKPQAAAASAEPLTVPDTPAAAPSAPIRDMSLRLTAADHDKVEVKVMETAGEIRVAVRSADPALTTSLQQGLGDLVGKMESRGMHAETWRPEAETSGSAPPARSESGQNGQQQSSGGDGSPGKQWREQQVLPPRRRNKPEWLREIDGTFDTLHSEITRTSA